MVYLPLLQNFLQMDTISIIIITKNEADNITDCINSCRKVAADVIVVDSGSTDGTVRLAELAGARVINISWAGFGAARNAGAKNARNNWILAIDADERITSSMAGSLATFANNDDRHIYGFKRQSFFLGQKIRFGTWGRDSVYRLYNRNRVSWDLSAVHEQLAGSGTVCQILPGIIEHYTVASKDENDEKTTRYAALSAEKYLEQGRRATFVKRFISPVFEFIKSYFLLLGFLDGRPGYIIAMSSARYVFLKYSMLYHLSGTRKG